MALVGTINSSNDFGLKNRIINGAMVIDQRNAGASVTISTSGVYALDRWKNRANGGGAFSVQQSSTAPAGFNTAVVYTVTTVDSSIAAGDNYWIIQDIEGYNVADLGFGTANAQTITMSFWVRSSVTGTYSVFLSNGTTYDRGYVATYTINAANTWEQKSVTIAGDTTGTWGKTNGGGLSAGFNLGAGTTYQTTAGSWGSAFVQATSGTTQWISNAGATFYITGVQLEKGSTATSFDYRSIGTELALCQRYCFVPTNIPMTGGSSSFVGNLQFPVTMRSAPSADVTKLGTYKNSSSFGVGPGANEFGIQNFVSGNSVGFSGVTPTSLGQTTQSAQVTYIYQLSGTTPSESTSVMNYVCTFGTGSRLILSAEL